jgi:hypothetical protein
VDSVITRIFLFWIVAQIEDLRISHVDFECFVQLVRIGQNDSLKPFFTGKEQIGSLKTSRIDSGQMTLDSRELGVVMHGISVKGKFGRVTCDSFAVALGLGRERPVIYVYMEGAVLCSADGEVRDGNPSKKELDILLNEAAEKIQANPNWKDILIIRPIVKIVVNGAGFCKKFDLDSVVGHASLDATMDISDDIRMTVVLKELSGDVKLQDVTGHGEFSDVLKLGQLSNSF